MARIRRRSDLDDLSRTERKQLNRVFKAASVGRREGLKPGPAARKAHTSITTIEKLAPELLTTDAKGHRTFTPADRLLRPGVSVIERGGGPVVVFTRGSRVASLASDYARTLDRYRAGLVGPEAFARFEGRRIGGVELESSADAIDDLDARGALEDLPFYDL